MKHTHFASCLLYEAYTLRIMPIIWSIHTSDHAYYMKHTHFGSYLLYGDNTLCVWGSFGFWVVFWIVVAVQRPSRRLHRRRLFFLPTYRYRAWVQPSLTARDRELVSALEVRIEPGDLNPRSLTHQSATLPTLPRAGWYCFQCLSGNWCFELGETYPHLS